MQVPVSPATAGVLAGLAVLCFVAGLYLRGLASSGSVMASTALAAGAGTLFASGDVGRRRREAALRGVLRRVAEVVRPLMGLAGGARLEQRLVWLGAGQTPEQFVANQVLAGAAGLVLGVLIAVVDGLGFSALVAGLVGAGVGWWLPAQHLESRFRAARAGIGRSALGFADFLVAAVQAGLPLESAVERLSRELPGRLPQLMARAVKEASLTGEPLDMTLDAMAREVDEPSMTSVVGAIAQARQTGGDLAGPLAGLVGAMRQERQQQIRAQARGRAAYSSLPLILVMLPGVMAPLGYVVFANFHGLGF